ncbi:MAG TPA: Spy/CpxP family protein refolding chaperone [Thermoanaerobaculia bacterium]|nr:Spy/CpxP family protein refolding chaperone [Thermoanaerobaculia bacterium]
MKRTMIAVAALGLTASLAFAGPGEGHGKRHGRHGKAGLSHHVAEKLNLTETQKQQVDQLHKGVEASVAPLFESMKATKMQLREAREANDTAREQSLRATMKAQKEQIRQIHETQHQQFLSVLTAEQRAQLEAMKSEQRSRRGKGDREKTKVKPSDLR